jgi:hypothetical protein
LTSKIEQRGRASNRFKLQSDDAQLSMREVVPAGRGETQFLKLKEFGQSFNLAVNIQTIILIDELRAFSF